MTGLGILILVILFFWIVWPLIARYLKQKAMERAEDYIRSSMGMPPRQKNRKKGQHSDEPYGNSSGKQSHHRDSLIPKEYAEDVEFIEIKDYSETKREVSSGKTVESYHESQISDVEWTEIKSRSK